MPNLITIDDLHSDVIDALLEKATHYAHSVLPHHQIVKQLTGHVVANLFFEPSTRTQNSFELAQKRLNLIVQSPNMHNSALLKGESVIETVTTLVAMGVEACVIRHEDDKLFEQLLDCGLDVKLVNAGSGQSAHPTQALIDLSVIASRRTPISDLSVALIGDVKHSRVARSQIRLLSKLGVKDIRVITPRALQFNESLPNIHYQESLEQGIKQADVICCLRLQKERFDAALDLDYTAYQQRYCLNTKHMSLASPDAIVLHPGPCMIGTDMTKEVANSAQSMVLQQVSHSVPMRMAVMDYVFDQL